MPRKILALQIHKAFLDVSAGGCPLASRAARLILLKMICMGITRDFPGF